MAFAIGSKIPARPGEIDRIRCSEGVSPASSGSAGEKPSSMPYSRNASSDGGPALRRLGGVRLGQNRSRVAV